MATSLQHHWDAKYDTDLTGTKFSWSQSTPALSLELIRELASEATELKVVDAGGGLSSLALDLVRGAAGCAVEATVIDISGKALEANKARLTEAEREKGLVTWIHSNILEAPMTAASTDIWHDRAVFHFLTSESEQKQYIELVSRVVKPNGVAIIATFDEDGGPTRCSDLDVKRWSVAQLATAFGGEFDLERGEKEDHITPSGKVQKFVYAILRRRSDKLSE